MQLVLAANNTPPLWLPSGTDMKLVAPELALVATIALVLIVPLVVRRNSYTTAGIVLAGAVGTTLLAYFVTLPAVRFGGVAAVAPDSAPMLVVDNFSVFFKLFLMLFVVLVTGLWLLGSAEREKDAPEFFVLLLGSALGMGLMVSTLNLLMMVIAMELASLPSYAIAAFNKRSKVGAEAALKYVIFGAVTAATMLYGISLLYGYYGTLDLTRIATLMYTQETDLLVGVVGVGLFAMLVGVGFKISAVPFHFWCPDVFEGAKIEVTTWLSVASKAAGICLLLRIIHAFTHPVGVELSVNGPEDLPVLSGLAWGIGIVAVLTCTIGNLAAYHQTSVKRLLAYSSIAHAGYMLMAGAVLLSVDPGTANIAVSAVVAYVLIYLFMNLGAFGTVALVHWQTGSEKFDAFTNLGRRAPWLAVPMAICLFSLIGMPPLGGFIVKFWLLKALFEAGSTMTLLASKSLLYGLVIVAVLNTLLSLFYYLRIVREMFLVDDDRPPLEIPWPGVAMVNVCAVVLVLTGTLFVDPLRRNADSYAMYLYTPSVVQTAEAPKPPGEPVATAAREETTGQ